jgi:hypothetical protein
MAIDIFKLKLMVGKMMIDGLIFFLPKIKKILKGSHGQNLNPNGLLDG